MTENKFEVFKFPAGEIQVKINRSEIASFSRMHMTKRIKCSDDIIELLQMASLTKEGGFSGGVFIPYLPFSRMDRKIDGYAYSLKVFADIINTARFSKVSTLDVHSNAAQYLINNFENIDPHKYQSKFLLHIGSDLRTLVIPDLGAIKRYPLLTKEFEWVVYCKKERDNTGNIVKTEIYGNVSGKNCIIFDDICDGGATFVEIAKELRRKGARALYLFVTHGIFSKGLDELFKYYDLVGCTNSFSDYTWADKYLNNFKVINI